MLRNHMVAQLELHSSALQLVQNIVPHLSEMDRQNRDVLNMLVQQQVPAGPTAVPQSPQVYQPPIQRPSGSIVLEKGPAVAASEPERLQQSGISLQKGPSPSPIRNAPAIPEYDAPPMYDTPYQYEPQPDPYRGSHHHKPHPDNAPLSPSGVYEGTFYEKTPNAGPILPQRPNRNDDDDMSYVPLY